MLRPPTALLVPALGIGMGHAKRLLVIGQALRHRGYRVVAAMRDLWTCADEFRQAGIALLQAPVHRSVVPRGEFKIASYADVVAACGFGAIESLWSTMLGWNSLVDLVLLRTAALVERRFGRSAPSSLGELIGGQAHVVCTYPELDIYAESRQQPAAGSTAPRRWATSASNGAAPFLLPFRRG